MFILDFVASTVMDNLIDWFYGQVVGFLGNFFAEMGNMGVELFDLDWVQAIVLFFSQLGWALFGVSLVVCVFECGIDYTTGRANIKDTALNILKGFLSVCLFTTVPVRLYSLSVTLQGTFASGLTGFGTSIGTVGQQIIEDLNGVESVTEMTGAAGGFGLGVITSPIMIIFCVILMAYAVIKVFFSNLKRGGILLIQIAVGSLYMFSIPRGYTDGFIQWIKQVIGLCLTAFLQSTILVAGLMVFKDHALLGLGLMLSANEVPRIAGTFGLDTTTRANIMSAVYTAQAAVNTTRTIVQAVASK
ncbi:MULTISPECIES: conjugal transfer protein TrbL family protein [Oscillospiraceae]|uniref:conjugal transfer protein TrbL family protein n=1 Tax=Oscillospiraceae TaxID=216572 RepID=UPI000B3671FE|nr:conjugal transfer protein TrbL family protein [Faecalibacterium sp. An122]MBM6910740.1 hypothetical protein [Oscillibacter valericigenes]OUQ37287.1 hypothetical protein B5E67_08560 [Faecalibacterium sp. An122]